MLPQHQRHAPALQLGHDIAQLLPGLFVPGGDAGPGRDQKLQQRAVGHPDADDRDLFSPERREIVLQSRKISLLSQKGEKAGLPHMSGRL